METSMILHSVEVAGIEVSALRVVHPRYLVSIFGSLRAGPHPIIEISSNGSHLPVEFRALLNRSFEDVSVDAEDCLMGPRIDLVELDDVYEWFDI